MKSAADRRFGKSHAFRYAVAGAILSSAYVLIAFAIDAGSPESNPIIFQASPILFGVLGFLIGHKEDLYRGAMVKAETDFLTGLANHSQMQKRLSSEVERSTRYGQQFSLVMLDLDKFKNVNDDFGHQKGDEILRLVADFLKNETRKTDFVARYGGEEFMVLMPGIDGAAALQSAERLRVNIRNLNGDAAIPEKYISASFGIADCPACATIKDDLISMADAALLFAKRKGRNHAAYFRSLKDVELRPGDFERIHRFLEGASLQSVKALAEAVESLELYSDGLDIKRVVNNLALRLGIGQRQRELLVLASQLHDVGKIGVPGSVLNKAGKLDPVEQALMRQHPEMGKRLLMELEEMQELFSAILYHHERWDGTGYPEGLKGDGIPLLARIVGILDAYRAMISNRPYRKALSRSEAIAQLRRGSGLQFDPELVEPFIEMVEQDSAAAADG